MGEERDLFSAAVQGVVPLTDRERADAPRAPRQVRVTANDRPPTVDRREDRVSVRAANVSRRLVRELGAGKHRPQATVDLHRLTAERARERLNGFLTERARAGHRCVLVVTGRGRGDGGGVLRSAVVEWIAGPLGHHVLALATAIPGDGGDGAYYVYLRRT